ncbi:MAG: 30S ribosomal protein S6 [Alphaproteobacteria bacterium]|jgi:small subunit ribosomal protein S6|nr:30S ribosomal protein S6 [Alphaproteobacteria bacterium]
MNCYETVFIARQDLTNAQVETMANTFTQVIKDHNGEVSKTEFCGLRNLAYKIKKNKKGHYVLMNISSPPEGITEMERQMKLSEDLLRHLTVRVEALDPNPSKLMQRAYTDDRYRGFDDDQDDLLGDQPLIEPLLTDRPSRPRFQADPTNDEGEIA